jgi:hypothetical protein
MPSKTNRLIALPEAADTAWLPGLPHAAIALAIAPVLGVAACVAGLLVATLVSFIVYLPLTVLTLNGGAALAEDAEAPPMTWRAQAVLLGLWTVTAWVTAWMAL